MAERTSDRWISVLQSVLLHGAVVASMAYGWWVYRQRLQQPAAQAASIEATIVDSSVLKNSAPPPPKREPQPEPAPETGPPTPTPEQVEERKAAEQRAVEEKRIAEEHQAAERKQEEEEAKRVAEQKRLEELKRKEDEKKKAEEARLRYQREQELRRNLEQEEHLMAAQSSGALANWQAQITARIQRAWLRPPAARPGIDCMVYVTQVPGGEVTNVRVGSCNGDASVRESIESAVYRASPLPPPPDPALFERKLEIRFIPND